MDNVVSFGKGGRALVIIPGLSVTPVTGNAAPLRVIFRKFTKGWKVFVIDRPDEVPEGATNADLAEAYVSTMASLGIADADIFGASQGAMIAQHIAVRHPEMVHSLVLGATLSRMNSTAEGVLGHWIQLAEERRWYDLNKDSFSRLYTDAYLKKNRIAVELVSKTMKPEDPERFIRLAKACLTGGPFGELGKISCPILVMGGEDDPVVTGEASREIARATGCELQMSTGLRHAIYDEDKTFYDRVLEFLSRQNP